MAYVELDFFREYLNNNAILPEEEGEGGEEESFDDAYLYLVLEAVAASIDRYCNTTFEDVGTGEGEDGYEIPASVQLATLIQGSRLVSRRNSPYGVAGSPEMQSELRLLSELDPDVRELLRNDRVMWGAY